MSREEIQKLLGGYATDTLTEAERSALFEAALEDQQLFDALAKDQALRDLLQDPTARQQLIGALGPAREPFAARAWHWLRQPAALALAGGVVVLFIAGGIVLRRLNTRREVMVADAIARNPKAGVSPSLAVEALELSRIDSKPKRQKPAAAAEAVPAETDVARAKLIGAPAAAPRAPQAPPPGTMASGALADTMEARKEMQAPVLRFSPRDGPQLALNKDKAKRSDDAGAATGYTLLLKGTDDAYSPVPSGTVFRAGDSVRLQVVPRDAGYIYLFLRDANAGWNLVARQQVDKDQGYMLPPTGGLQSDSPATLELLLVLSRAEQPGSGTPRPAVTDSLVSQDRASVRITLEFR